jgi:hypothetical protein
MSAMQLLRINMHYNVLYYIYVLLCCTIYMYCTVCDVFCFFFKTYPLSSLTFLKCEMPTIAPTIPSSISTVGLNTTSRHMNLKYLKNLTLTVGEPLTGVVNILTISRLRKPSIVVTPFTSLRSDSLL